MAKNYGPPELYSSSDSDFEEYGLMSSFDYDENGKRIKNRNVIPVPNKTDDIADKFYACLGDGNVDEFRTLWEANRSHFDINEQIKNILWTPLMIASHRRHVELVKYLLFDLKVDPDKNSIDMTALILCCSGSMNIYEDSYDVSPIEEAKTRQICQWLLECKAMVNKANLRRETPLMYAASSGFVSVIKLLLKNKATLEACDVDEKTALFYAVNENRFEATKALIEAGAIVDVEDRYQKTPKQMAEEKGFNELLKLFPPDPVVPFVPNDVTAYNIFMDHIPTAFPEKNASAYSPDVYVMLNGMRASAVDYNFYEFHIDLSDLLTITDERLNEIGVTYPYHRKRILLGLLKFHEKSWSKESLYIPKLNATIRDYFHMLANTLKQLIVIESTIKFVENHPLFSIIPISDESHRMRQMINQELLTVQTNVLKLLQTFNQFDAVATPPLFVCQKTAENALDRSRTFRARIYKKFQIFGCIAMGIATFLVIKSRSN